MRSSRSLVLRFRCAGQRGQVSEGFLDLDRDWWWGGQMGSVCLVTVLVGDECEGDRNTSRCGVGRNSLAHGHGLSLWSCLDGADLLLSDSVFGLEAATEEDH